MASEDRRKHEGPIKVPDMRIYWGTILVVCLALAGYKLIADRAGYVANLYVDILGVAATVLILDRRAQLRADRQLKAQLIREMGARDSGIALRAVKELEAHSWLKDGSLQHVNLCNANLQEVNLFGANLQRAYLNNANLQGADMENVNLQEAILWHANLQEAILWCANLQGAVLAGANLHGANLMYANLREANLLKVNLSCALVAPEQLRTAKSLDGAIMPDGTAYTPGSLGPELPPSNETAPASASGQDPAALPLVRIPF
jgi:hypothetical protein